MISDPYYKNYYPWDRFKLDEFIYPVFVCPGEKIRQEVPLMDDVYRLSCDVLVKRIEVLYRLGIRSILLFGSGQQKDASAGDAWRKGNLVAHAVRLAKKTVPQMTVITDVCLCAYTSHGHCGIVKEGRIDRGMTLEALSAMALSHAQSGADFVAPSAMVPGQVDAIRNTLDNEGHYNTKIMGYSAKFASHFYGPFRTVADSAPRFGDRRGYQLDYFDKDEPIKRIGQDIREGADIVMVKPALGYLDIVSQAKERYAYPLAVYNVSGEYAMVKQGAQKMCWDEERMVFELMSSFKRAGADFIITYHAASIVSWMSEYEKEKREYGEVHPHVSSK